MSEKFFCFVLFLKYNYSHYTKTKYKLKRRHSRYCCVRLVSVNSKLFTCISLDYFKRHFYFVSTFISRITFILFHFQVQHETKHLFILITFLGTIFPLPSNGFCWFLSKRMLLLEKDDRLPKSRFPNAPSWHRDRCYEHSWKDFKDSGKCLHTTK